MKRFLLATVLLSVLALPSAAAAASKLLPTPVDLEDNVRFWTRVYSEVSTDEGFIHDSRELGVVYEVMHFSKDMSSRTRERRTEKTKSGIAQALRSLGKGKRKNLNREEKRILALWPSGVSNSTLREAASRVRFQLGQANKFRAGIIRSGAWSAFIRRNLVDMGLPIELAALPHVESSFNPTAYSRVGAAGLWQFTRSTGRRFMRIDHVVDERLDPFLSSVAAARLLDQNRKVTGSWPLAITAYNHGAAGMRRAVSKLGTQDMGKISRTYRSRTFGFASRNFYAEFLAALAVSSNYERYFGRLYMEEPVTYTTAKMPYYTPLDALSRSLGISSEQVKKANPALLPTVWKGAKYVPKGFELRIPQGQLSLPLSQALAQIPKSHRHAAQTRDLKYTVRRGDTLSQISSRYGVSVSELMALNGLRSRHHIRAGQQLRLPQADGGVQLASAPAVAPVPMNGRYTVRKGDTISRIAARFGVSEGELLSSNSLRNRNRIHPGQVLRVPDAAKSAPLASRSSSPAPPASGLYKVRKGDTVTKIAKQFGISEQTLLATNAVRNRNEIQVGQLLRVATPPDTLPTGKALAPPLDGNHPETAVALTPASSAERASLQAALASDASGGAGDSDLPGEDAATRALIADPNDYSVARDGTIEVQAAETLGHYADWLGLRTARLREINHLRYGTPLAVHSKLRLDFGSVSPERFEERRMEYHQALQEEFFERFQISGTEIHVIRRGDSLWTLSHRTYRVPVWLLRQYNPDLDFEALSAGTRINVPRLERREMSSGSVAPSEGRLSGAPPSGATRSSATARRADGLRPGFEAGTTG